MHELDVLLDPSLCNRTPMVGLIRIGQKQCLDGGQRCAKPLVLRDFRSFRHFINNLHDGGKGFRVGCEVLLQILQNALDRVLDVLVPENGSRLPDGLQSSLERPVVVRADAHVLDKGAELLAGVAHG